LEPVGNPAVKELSTARVPRYDLRKKYLIQKLTLEKAELFCLHPQNAKPSLLFFRYLYFEILAG
jgi:hypothetical protein